MITWDYLGYGHAKDWWESQPMGVATVRDSCTVGPGSPRPTTTTRSTGWFNCFQCIATSGFCKRCKLHSLSNSRWLMLVPSTPLSSALKQCPEPCGELCAWSGRDLMSDHDSLASKVGLKGVHQWRVAPSTIQTCSCGTGKPPFVGLPRWLWISVWCDVWSCWSNVEPPFLEGYANYGLTHFLYLFFEDDCIFSDGGFGSVEEYGPTTWPLFAFQQLHLFRHFGKQGQGEGSQVKDWRPGQSSQMLKGFGFGVTFFGNTSSFFSLNRRGNIWQHIYDQFKMVQQSFDDLKHSVK